MWYSLSTASMWICLCETYPSFYYSFISMSMNAFTDVFPKGYQFFGWSPWSPSGIYIVINSSPFHVASCLQPRPVMLSQLPLYFLQTLLVHSSSGNFLIWWSQSFNHLISHSPLVSLWRISDSNRWPPACKAGALASWANPPNPLVDLVIDWLIHWFVIHLSIFLDPSLPSPPNHLIIQ